MCAVIPPNSVKKLEGKEDVGLPGSCLINLKLVKEILAYKSFIASYYLG